MECLVGFLRCLGPRSRTHDTSWYSMIVYHDWMHSYCMGGFCHWCGVSKQVQDGSSSELQKPVPAVANLATWPYFRPPSCWCQPQKGFNGLGLNCSCKGFTARGHREAINHRNRNSSPADDWIAGSNRNKVPALTQGKSDTQVHTSQSFGEVSQKSNDAVHKR